MLRRFDERPSGLDPRLSEQLDVANCRSPVNEGTGQVDHHGAVKLVGPVTDGSAVPDNVPMIVIFRRRSRQNHDLAPVAREEIGESSPERTRTSGNDEPRPAVLHHAHNRQQMTTVRPSVTPLTRARQYFAMQSVAGIVWWIAVFVSDRVREWTLGGWDPSILVAPDIVLFVGASAVAAITGRRWWAVVVTIWSTGITATLAVYGLLERATGWGVVAMVVASAGSVAGTLTLWLGRLPTELFFVGPFAFRVAQPRTGRRHLLRSLLQLVVFWTIFFVLIPWVLVLAERRLMIEWEALQSDRWRAIGAVGFVAGSAAGLWSCVTMAIRGQGTPLPAETARVLVVRGPYRYVRNPMAVAGALQTASVGVWAGAWSVIAIGLVGAVAWNVLIRPTEEADLARRFGESYEHYRGRVRCWIPTLSRPSR